MTLLRLRPLRAMAATLMLMTVTPMLVTVQRAEAAAAAPAPAPLPPASAPPPAAGAIPGVGTAPAPGSATATPAPPVSGQPPAVEPAVPPTEAALPEPEPAPRVVVTGDLKPEESDHDAVVGAWGIEVRPVATTLPVFARRASTGCPIAPVANGDASTVAPAGTYDCLPVAVSTLGIKHWFTRNLGWNAGVALALGGGSQGDRLLDSYFGFGPAVGASVLLGNWRHLTVAASPAFSFVWWKAAGSADATYVADMRADIEGELHFGFIGIPALSLGMRSGVLLRLEKSADVTLWAFGVSGATTLRGLVSDLTLRYYF